MIVITKFNDQDTKLKACFRFFVFEFSERRSIEYSIFLGESLQRLYSAGVS